MQNETAQWHERQVHFQKLNRIFLIVYIGVTIAVLLRGISVAYNRAILYSVISLFMLGAPRLVEKAGRLTIPADGRFLFYLFSFGAVEFGSAMDAYDWIGWWDLLLHGLSGALIALIGLFVYNGLRHNQGQLAQAEQKLALVFMNLEATTSAAIWEYYEFILDTFFGFDAQYSAAGGSETMTDMMGCTAGGLLLSLWFFWSWRQGKSNFLGQTVEHFYACNREGRAQK